MALGRSVPHAPGDRRAHAFGISRGLWRSSGRQRLFFRRRRAFRSDAPRRLNPAIHEPGAPLPGGRTQTMHRGDVLGATERSDPALYLDLGSCRELGLSGLRTGRCRPILDSPSLDGSGPPPVASRPMHIPSTASAPPVPGASRSELISRTFERSRLPRGGELTRRFHSRVDASKNGSLVGFVHRFRTNPADFQRSCRDRSRSRSDG